jgi:hypothetical protein
MKFFSRREWKKEAYSQSEKPALGWMIAGIIFILAILKFLLFP